MKEPERNNPNWLLWIGIGCVAGIIGIVLYLATVVLPQLLHMM